MVSWLLLAPHSGVVARHRALGWPGVLARTCLPRLVAKVPVPGWPAAYPAGVPVEIRTREHPAAADFPARPASWPEIRRTRSKESSAHRVRKLRPDTCSLELDATNRPSGLPESLTSLPGLWHVSSQKFIWFSQFRHAEACPEPSRRDGGRHLKTIETGVFARPRLYPRVAASWSLPKRDCTNGRRRRKVAPFPSTDSKSTDP